MAEECTCDSKLAKVEEKTAKVEELEEKIAGASDELWDIEYEYESVEADYEDYLLEKEKPSQGEEGELCLVVERITICYPPDKEDDFQQLKDKIEKFQKKLEKLKKKIEEKEDKISELSSKLTTALDDLSEAESEFYECEAKLITTDDGVSMKKKCATKCKGCGRYYSPEAFSASIEAWELLNK